MSFHKAFLIAVFIAMGTTLFNCSDAEGKPQKIETIKVVDSSNNKVIDVLKDTCDSTKRESYIKGEITPPLPVSIGKVITIDGEIVIEKKSNRVLNYSEVEIKPEFKNTPQHLSSNQKINYFNNQISKYINDRFDLKTAINLGLVGKHKIHTQFTIDTLGNVKNIKIRAPHITLENETRTIINKLPQFIPAKNINNKSIPVKYVFPIIFNIK